MRGELVDGYRGAPAGLVSGRAKAMARAGNCRARTGRANLHCQAKLSGTRGEMSARMEV